MTQLHNITESDRERIEKLIKSFDDHGCGFGFDVQAQEELRLLLDALDDLRSRKLIDSYSLGTGLMALEAFYTPANERQQILDDQRLAGRAPHHRRRGHPPP